uniref:CHK domain-containing protein n=1 Tax=Rhabditophanes sp. KR3021 TaxID=114890 RepID=A0AC35U3E3_9BILA
MVIFATQQLEDSNIEGTKTDVKWVVESLEEKNRDFKLARGNSKVTKIDAFDISGGKGFVSKVYKITIHFDDKSKEPFLSVLKIPGIESITEALDDQKVDKDETSEIIDTSTIEKLHNKECQFYNTFTEIPDLKIVKCYGTRKWMVGEKEGALIMDYVGSTASNIEFMHGLNIHQARNILKEIHNLQIYFFSLPSKKWENEYKVGFDMKDFEKIDVMLTNNWAQVRTFVPSQLYKHYEEDIISLIDNFCQVLQFVCYDIAHLEGNIKSFVHADLWCNNVMFAVDSNGNPGNEVEAIIDWQISYIGSIAADIARTVVIGCQPEIRRDIETTDLPKYYQNMKNEVINRGGQFEMTWEMFKLNYDYCMIDQSMQLLLLYRFALLNYSVPEEAGDYLWDARKYALGSRIVFAIIDAVKKCRLLNPEWLLKKVKE